MGILVMFLMVLAAVLFLLAFVGISSTRYNFLAGGLFFWLLSEMVAKYPIFMR